MMPSEYIRTFSNHDLGFDIKVVTALARRRDELRNDGKGGGSTMTFKSEKNE